MQEKSPVSIGLTENQRTGVADILNATLADAHVLYIKTRNYHWNVTGMAFKPLHELFEEQYTAMATEIDDIAERIRSLGFFAPGSMEEFRKLSRLIESGDMKGDAEKMLRSLIADHEALIQYLCNDQEDAMEKHGDAGTQDFLIGLMTAHEKMVWMLRAHVG